MEKIVLKNDGLLQFTYLKNIIYCRGNEDCTTFYLQNDSSLSTDKGIEYYKNKLPASGFISPENGVLVNIAHVASLRTTWPCYIELTNGERIHMAYFRKKQIIEKIERLQSC
jgi:two-component system LytT family response regulator